MKIFFCLSYFLLLVILINNDRFEKALINESADKNFKLVEDLQIGDKSSDIIFGNWPLKLTVNSKGNFFIADPQSYSVKVFSKKGQLVKEIGQQGRGPKEFGYLRSIDRTVNNQIVILDSNNRITVINPNLYEVIDEIKVPRLSGGWVPHAIKAVQSGYLVIYNQILHASKKNSKENLLRTALINHEGSFVIQNFIEIRVDQRFIMDSGSSIWRTTLPFGRKSIVDVGKYGTVFYGWSETIDINRIDLNTKQIDTAISSSHHLVKVTDKDLETNINYDPKSKKGDILINEADIPKYFPAYDWFVADDLNRIWIAVNTEDRQNYSLQIYDRDGTLLDKTTFPKSIELKEVRDGYAYGIAEDENGVQSVVRYTINGLKK